MEQIENSASTQRISTSHCIHSILQPAVEKGLSFALWRLPQSEEVNVIVSEKNQAWKDTALETTVPGFLIAPFEPMEEKVFLPADTYYLITRGTILKNGEEVVGEEIAAPPSVKKTSYHFAGAAPVPSLLEETEKNRGAFLDLVARGLEEIEKGTFEKIVPSRTKRLAVPRNTDLVEYFEKLCMAYPNAMISLLSTPQTGTWIGASPELLVKVDKHQVFHTVALAGTQLHRAGDDLKSISWTQKDIEEQALVSRYIINCFKKIRLREFDEHGPKTVLAGNLLHLKTDFKADMAATNFPQLGTVMLQLLHPTSAVCGMPLQNALDFLRKEEGYRRELYAGFLGPVNVASETHLYVNLRCMQVFAEQAQVYAGAGVTSDSQPEKEWLETEIKMSTLLKVVQP